jgi:hypothetical protein
MYMFAGLISFKLYQFNWNGGLRILMCLNMLVFQMDIKLHEHGSWSYGTAVCYSIFPLLKYVESLEQDLHFYWFRGVVVVVMVWYLDLQLPMQSVPITTNVVSSNPTQARYTRYNIVIKNVSSDLRQVDGFLPLPIPINRTATI